MYETYLIWYCHWGNGINSALLDNCLPALKEGENNPIQSIFYICKTDIIHFICRFNEHFLRYIGHMKTW